MPTLKSLRRKVKYRLIYFLVKFLIAISNWMSRSAWLAFCGGLGKMAGWFAVESRTRAVRHLTLAYGNEKTGVEIEKLSRDMFVMLGKNAGDVLRATNIDSLPELEKFVVMKG